MKRTTLIIVVLIVAMLSVSAVAAQDPPTDSGDQGVSPRDQPGGPEQGRPGQGDRAKGGQPEWMADYEDEWDVAVADLLGVTVEELLAAKEDGTRLEDLAEANGLEAEAFQAAMDELFTSFLDQAVNDGVLTEEEAAEITERHAERGSGERGGRGGPGRGGPGQGEPGQGGPGQQPLQGESGSDL